MYEKIKAAIRSHTDTHRLVFWYDPQATHHGILEELETGAEILEVDNSETYREECGLDPGFREFFQRHVAFFRNSRERFLPLQEIIDPKQETEQSLARKMIGILAAPTEDKRDGIERFEDIIFEFAEEELNGSAPRWNAVVKFDLDSCFREELTPYLPEISETITSLGAVLEVFLRAWDLETGEDVSAAGRSCRLLLQQWRDSFSADRRYYAMAEYVQNALGISAQIASYPVKRLADLSLFPAVDSELAKKLVERVLEPHADADFIRKTAAGRLNSSRRQDGTGTMHSIYSLIVSYIDFEKELHRADLSPGTQTELFNRYTEKLYRLDLLYRTSLSAYRSAGSLGSLSPIVERLEGRYSQHFLQPLAEIWDKRVHEGGTPIPPGVMVQERFFKDVVRPSLNRGEKLVVVISDALRYEAGCELKERLAALNRIQAEVEPWAADNAKTEASLPDAVASEFDILVGIVKKFANQLNRTHILITADHGFLYQNEKPAEASMLAAENPAYGYKDRRYVMGTDTPGVHFFSPASAASHMDSRAPLHFAEGLYRIRKQGGGTRFVHGGLSLQEITVPLIRVRVGRKDDVETVGVAIMVPANTVITTPVYTVNFFQEEPVTEKRHPLQLSVFFAAEDGTLLSDRIEMSFDSADPNAQNRSSSAEFHFGPQVNNYNGRRIQLVLEKLIGGTSVPYTKVDFTYQTFGDRDF